MEWVLEDDHERLAWPSNLPRTIAIVVSIGIHGLAFWHWYDSHIRSIQSMSPPPRPIVVKIVTTNTMPQPKVVDNDALPQKINQHAMLKTDAESQLTAISEEIRQSEIQQPPEAGLFPEKERVAESNIIEQSEAIQEELDPQEETVDSINTGVSYPQPVLFDEESEAELEERRKNYLALLRATIAAHKTYPMIARRRGIQGSVEVSFLLSANGDAREIRVNGGAGLLRIAAKQAIEQVQSFPPLPEGITPPLSVQYAMNFTLQ